MFSLYVCTTNENHLFRKARSDITINLLLRYLFLFFHVYFLHLDLFVRVLGASLLFSTSKLKALFIHPAITTLFYSTHLQCQSYYQGSHLLPKMTLSS